MSDPASTPVSFPSDYRTHFQHYLSLDRVQNPDQIIHLYANALALQGPGPDGALPYGSVIVGEIHAAQRDAEGEVRVSSLGQRVQGPLVLIAVMERGQGWDARHPEGLRNGDWEFAAFTPQGAPADKDLDGCRACHAPLTDRNHLFSYEHFQ